MDIKHPIDSAPLTEAFSFAREKDRAMHDLKGILSGIIADKRLNDIEFLFLDSWLKSQQYLAEDPDVLEILRRVGEILEDGQVSHEELRLMSERIQQIASAKDIPTLDRLAKIDEMLGFVTGIAADGVLNDDEIRAVSTWLQKTAAIYDVWPATIIGNRLALILEDGIITDEERADLLQLIKRVTGREPEVSHEISTEVWEDKIDSLKLDGATFCLTGDFVSGDRDSVEMMLKCLGP